MAVEKIKKNSGDLGRVDALQVVGKNEFVCGWYRR